MMSLPNLAPTDSHSLWYTSTHHPPSHPPLPTPFSPPSSHSHSHHNHPSSPQSPRRPPPPRTPHHHLLASEALLSARKANIQNWGLTYLRPPGITKSLHQLREEKRELEEHAEALRREQRVLELAEAEMGVGDVGGDMAMAMGMEGGGLGGGEMEGMGEGEGEGERDLDDEVPDADGTGLDGDTTSEEEDEEEEEEGDDDTEANSTQEEVPPGVLANRMPEDVYREAILHGTAVHTTGFSLAGEGGLSDEEGEAEGMLQEEDLLPSQNARQRDGEMDLDMDLDADIPSAEEEGYEHTDTEEELESSSEEDGSRRRSYPIQYLSGLSYERQVEIARERDMEREREMAERDRRREMQMIFDRLDAAEDVGASLVRSDGTQGSADLGRVGGGGPEGWSGSGGELGSPRQRRRRG